MWKCGKKYFVQCALHKRNGSLKRICKEGFHRSKVLERDITNVKKQMNKYQW